MPVQRRMSVVRPVAQVREPQRAAVQARRARAASKAYRLSASLASRGGGQPEEGCRPIAARMIFGQSSRGGRRRVINAARPRTFSRGVCRDQLQTGGEMKHRLMLL